LNAERNLVPLLAALCGIACDEEVSVPILLETDPETCFGCDREQISLDAGGTIAVHARDPATNDLLEEVCIAFPPTLIPDLAGLPDFLSGRNDSRLADIERDQRVLVQLAVYVGSMFDPPCPALGAAVVMPQLQAEAVLIIDGDPIVLPVSCPVGPMQVSPCE
jgi:hypothetical protein